MKYYIFRINYSDDIYFNQIRESILKGELRQGWGAEGMDVRNDLNSFITAWNSKWGEGSSTNEQIKNKYNNLRTMLNIEIGDYIIVPKLDINKDYPCRSFTVLRCTGIYRFDIPKFANDFGHVISVECLYSCTYDGSLESKNISAKFTAYRSPLNNIWNVGMLNMLKSFFDRMTTSKEKMNYTDSLPQKSLIELMSSEVDEEYNSMTYHILDSLRKLKPRDFEDIIIELFEKNGYILKKRNDYDRLGGDIDITLSLDNQSFLARVFNGSKSVDEFEINIQAKKKTGIDYADADAIEQMILRKRTRGTDFVDVNIVIDLADEFQKETIEYAEANKILLIDGLGFASMLIQFGVITEMN